MSPHDKETQKKKGQEIYFPLDNVSHINRRYTYYKPGCYFIWKSLAVEGGTSKKFAVKGSISSRLGQIYGWYRSKADKPAELALFIERFLTELVESLCSYTGVKRLVDIILVKGCLNQPAP